MSSPCSRAHLHPVAPVDRLLAGIDAPFLRPEPLRIDRMPAAVEGQGRDESRATLVVGWRDLVQHEAFGRGQVLAFTVLIAEDYGRHLWLRLVEEQDRGGSAGSATVEDREVCVEPGKLAAPAPVEEETDSAALAGDDPEVDAVSVRRAEADDLPGAGRVLAAREHEVRSVGQRLHDLLVGQLG